MLSEKKEAHLNCPHTFIVPSDVPKSYAEAINSENIDFWKPGIEKEC